MSNKQTQLAGWMTWTDSDGNAMAGPESVWKLYVQSVMDTMEISQLQTMRDALWNNWKNMSYLDEQTLSIIQETILQKRQEYMSELQGMIMQTGV
jgi:L-2-hydroxyglutarate oxidase LhgO